MFKLIFPIAFTH